MSVLRTRRLVLRPLVPGDFAAYSEVRKRNGDFLTRWEPLRAPGQPDPADSYDAFVARCSARHRERQLGTAYGFGAFCGPRLIGEINVNNVHRGALQSADVGYWVDQAHTGNAYCPEAVVGVCRFSFEKLGLHRIQISIIPRNHASRRVVEKLELRSEGVSIGYLQINGAWEDHIRYAITSEEWESRGADLSRSWLEP
ncbi:MAG: GNAT family N-acetyltransferase [Acidimicrobiia bacterium]|nr:GNAT family N-acetyltransferase [Acidimicrobiia bacterium]